MALQIAHRIGIGPTEALGMTFHHLRVLVEADVEEKRETKRRGLEAAWHHDLIARHKKPLPLEEVLGWAGPPPVPPEQQKIRRKVTEQKRMQARMLDRWRESVELRVEGS